MKVIHFVLAIVLLTPCLTFAKWKLIHIPHPHIPHIPHKTKKESSSAKTKQESPSPTSSAASPPSPAATEAGEGPTAFIQVQAGGYAQSQVASVDLNLGYNFSDHFGADIGMPLFYVRSPLTLVTSADWKTTTLMGDPYIDAHYKLTRFGASLTTVLTGTVPASSPERIYTTGRAEVDWFNHIEPAKPLGLVTPFINLGAANGTINRYYMPRPYSIGRPYQTLGPMGDGEVGASVKLPYGLRAGASAYALLPNGNQKVFSRLVTPGATVVGAFTNNRYYFNAFETTGSSSIDRDNGFSGWVEYTKLPKVTLQVGYTHSIHYRYDMITLSVNYDGTALIRTITGKTGQ
ncbi:MAG TPA: hypothetical protein VG028_12715 [Terriglobia bacterium]|nr:hypothetical protein [Terriglobia bacterium]